MFRPEQVFPDGVHQGVLAGLRRCQEEPSVGSSSEDLRESAMKQRRDLPQHRRVVGTAGLKATPVVGQEEVAVQLERKWAPLLGGQERPEESPGEIWLGCREREAQVGRDSRPVRVLGPLEAEVGLLRQSTDRAGQRVRSGLRVGIPVRRETDPPRGRHRRARAVDEVDPHPILIPVAGRDEVQRLLRERQKPFMEVRRITELPQYDQRTQPVGGYPRGRKQWRSRRVEWYREVERGSLAARKAPAVGGDLAPWIQRDALRSERVVRSKPPPPGFSVATPNLDGPGCAEYGLEADALVADGFVRSLSARVDGVDPLDIARRRWSGRGRDAHRPSVVSDHEAVCGPIQAHHHRSLGAIDRVLGQLVQLPLAVPNDELLFLAPLLMGGLLRHEEFRLGVARDDALQVGQGGHESRVFELFQGDSRRRPGLYGRIPVTGTNAATGPAVFRTSISSKEAEFSAARSANLARACCFSR